MKATFTLLAVYNRHANSLMYGILDQLPPERRDEVLHHEAGSYFHTILGLLNHQLVADLGWLSAYRDAAPPFPVLDVPALHYTNPGWGNPLHTVWEDLAAHRKAVDQVFIDFVASLDDTRLTAPLILTRTKGRFRTVLHEALLHLFNHATHHRGAVAQIMDSLGIENDYSNILPLITMEPVAEAT